MRSQHSELQPACLHLPRSRGAGAVPSAEHVQGKRALQGGDRRCFVMNSVILGKTPNQCGLGFLIRFVWKTILMKYCLFLLNCEVQEYKTQMLGNLKKEGNLITDED